MTVFQADASARRRAAARKPHATGLRVLGLGVAASLAALGFGGPGAAQDGRAIPRPPVADTSTSLQALRTWVLATGDNHGRPFVIVDKVDARVAAFDPAGAMLASAPVLLGLAQGDDSPAGIGDRALASIGPEERITPAGRFAGELGENLAGRAVLWVDYDAAISLHPVATAVVSERRQARLDSPATSDNRISYGCINVPADFYSAVVLPMFRDAPGVVYVLPETRSLDAQFFHGTAAPADPGRVSASLQGDSPDL